MTTLLIAKTCFSARSRLVRLLSSASSMPGQN